MPMTVTNPPRRAAVIDLLSNVDHAIHVNEIASKLGVSETLLPALSRVLDDLVFDGTVSPRSGQRFRLAKKERGRDREREEVEGFLSVHPRGFGFVQRERDIGDVFIPPEAMIGALHGDRVRARIIARGARGAEGSILEVLERRPARIAGTLRRRGAGTWIEPDDSRLRGPIVLPAGADAGADGEVVIADIVRFPESPEEHAEARLVEVLGPPGTPDVEVRKILAVAGVIEEHPRGASEEAKACGVEVPASALEGREDLTHLPLPTIDPEDARDHDDALWAERLPEGGYRVWIAIADVSHYVRPDTGLDGAARDRGCSIYLPDRAIPMLPRELSGNLCSLLPGVIRLCLCVQADLDASGVLVKSRIVEGFMRSQAKLTYEGVARALKLTTAGNLQPEAEALHGELAVLREISSLLRASRMRRGALDFDLPEAKITVDQATRMPVHATKRARDPGVAKAYQLVEELMLLANETVAAFLVQHGAPTIFRDHAPPDPEKIARFSAICKKLGVELDPDDAQEPKKLSAFVKKVKAHPNRALIDTLLVRSLKQAVYDVQNVGHFGLASDAYLHFTSPIRRYPDLVVHRGVRAILRKQRVDSSDEAVETMRKAAQVASERERRAMQVERDVVDLYGAILMKESIGDMFAGAVTAVVSSGIFVMLDDPFVSVLVKFEALGDDAYEADEESFSVTGKRTGERITLGDPMMVQIEDVSIERRMTFGRRVSVGAERGESKRGEQLGKKGGEKKGGRRAKGKANGRSEAAGPKGGKERPGARDTSGSKKKSGAKRGKKKKSR